MRFKMQERILVFAPHNDDEIIGLGGTLADFAARGHEIAVCEVTSGYNPERVERIKNEARKAHRVIGAQKDLFLDLPVVRLGEVSQMELTKRFAEAVAEVRPTIAFIPHIGDMHTDHRITADAAMVVLRPYEAKELHTIYAYETLSETEWNIPSVTNAFLPDTWFDITDTLETKLRAMACYETQLNEFPHPRSLEAIRALAEYRGSTVGCKAAEAFRTIRRIVKNGE